MMASNKQVSLFERKRCRDDISEASLLSLSSSNIFEDESSNSSLDENNNKANCLNRNASKRLKMNHEWSIVKEQYDVSFSFREQSFHNEQRYLNSLSSRYIIFIYYLKDWKIFFLIQNLIHIFIRVFITLFYLVF